jgi:hypothetical protein
LNRADRSRSTTERFGGPGYSQQDREEKERTTRRLRAVPPASAPQKLPGKEASAVSITRTITLLKAKAIFCTDDAIDLGETTEAGLLFRSAIWAVIVDTTLFGTYGLDAGGNLYRVDALVEAAGIGF